jgi:uncharacterized protein (TIGR02266 family)
MRLHVSSERRAAPRHSVTIPVELSHGTSFSLHACNNLSSGGAFFRHAIPFHIGTLVDVKFTLPGDHLAIHCKGEVANVPAPEDFGMGVRFVGLTGDEQQRIGQFASRWGEAV